MYSRYTVHKVHKLEFTIVLYHSLAGQTLFQAQGAYTEIYFSIKMSSIATKII